MAAVPLADDRVFIINFHERDAWVLRVRLFRVRVHVSQKVPRVFLLKLDHFRYVIIDPLLHVGEFFHLREITVPGVERPADVEVNIDVDPHQFHLVNKPVEPVEFFLVHLAVAEFLVLPPDFRIDEMKAHDVDPERAQTQGEPCRVGFLREVRVKRKVHAPETERFAGPIDENVPGDSHLAGVSRRGKTSRRSPEESQAGAFDRKRKEWVPSVKGEREENREKKKNRAHFFKEREGASASASR